MPLPRGLVFAPRASAAVRKKRLAFAVFGLLAFLALGWPVYPLVSTVRPFVLGLPFSFAWVALWLLLVFAALFWLYRTGSPEHTDPPPTTDRS